MKNKKVIKIYNELFDYNLKASAFKVYIYLSSFFWWKKRTCVKLQTIASRCNISINTAQNAVNELVAKELITKCVCHKDHKRTTNIYTVTQLTGKFTIIERSMFFQDIDNSAFKIYCAISMRRNLSNKAFPSLTTIQNDSGTSRNTVIEKVQLLIAAGYINKERYIVLSGSFGNNNYTVIKMSLRAILFWLVLKAKTVFSNITQKLVKMFDNAFRYINIDFDRTVLFFCRMIYILLILLYDNVIVRHLGEKNTS